MCFPPGQWMLARRRLAKAPNKVSVWTLQPHIEPEWNFAAAFNVTTCLLQPYIFLWFFHPAGDDRSSEDDGGRTHFLELRNVRVVVGRLSEVLQFVRKPIFDGRQVDFQILQRGQLVEHLVCRVFLQTGITEVKGGALVSELSLLVWDQTQWNYTCLRSLSDLWLLLQSIKNTMLKVLLRLTH